MSKQLRMVLISIAVLAVLLVSAVQPLAARADDSTPPPAPASGDTSASAAAVASQAPAAAATQPPAAADTSAPASAATQPPAAADTSAPASAATQPPAAADTSAPTAAATQPPSSASTSAASAETSVAPASTSAASAETSAAPAGTSVAPTDTSTLVGSVPTGTSVVVLDATGTPVALATQTAAAIIKTGDPMWCPGSQAPGTTGCTTGYSSVAALITTGLGSVTPKAGTVYFESTYSTNDATFDGSTAALSAWKAYALTLQGGWNSTTNAVSGVSTFSVPLTITNWAADVTLNDITISGATGDGLTVQTTGNITVHNVKSNHNSGNGAYLNNVSPATASIIISNSDFSDNGTGGESTDGFGLEAISNGSITLTDVTADENYDDGAYLDNCLDNETESCTNGASNNGISVDNSGISGGNGFNYNGKGNTSADGYGNGLESYSTESVTLTNVTADGNLYDGALLGYNNNDDTFDEIGGNITVTGGDFSDNNIDDSYTNNPAGLEAYADGSIQVSDTTANDNWDDGAYLENDFGSSTGGITVDSSTFGKSVTSGNGLDGTRGLFQRFYQP